MGYRCRSRVLAARSHARKRSGFRVFLLEAPVFLSRRPRYACSGTLSCLGGTTLACKFDKCSREIARDTTKVPEQTQWLQGHVVVSSLCPGSAGSIPTLQCGQTKPQSALIEPLGRPVRISSTNIGKTCSTASNGLYSHSQPPWTDS